MDITERSNEFPSQTISITDKPLMEEKIINHSKKHFSQAHGTPVSYTHLTLPTKRIV